MFKFKKKSLTVYVSFILLLLFLCGLIPVLSTPTLDIFKYPLTLLTLLRREVKGIIFFHRNLIQNERLKKEIDFLKQKINTLNEIYLENERLKKLLSFKQNSAYKVIASQVIGRSAESWSSVIIINKGRHSGIKQGMIAINYLGLLGRVVESTSSSSKIMLINDPNLAVSAVIQRNRQEGLVSGTLGGYLVMRYLPKDCDIKSGDAIVTSGLTQLYPKGLLIGTVIDIQEEFSGLNRYAIVKPAVDPSSIEEVLIIIP